MTTIQLRPWQKEASDQALNWFLSEQECSQYFILNVAPGAGKTLCAAYIAKELIQREEIERVIIIAPRAEVVNQWGKEFHQVTGRDTAKITGADTDFQDYGTDLCATWSAVSGLLGGFQQVCEQHKTLIICDEHHHAAVEAVWGKGADDAFKNSKYTLLLTGTPFRGDGQEAVWLAHDNQGKIDHPEEGVYTLNYGEAVDLEYCRPITFHRHEGKFTVDLEDNNPIRVSGDGVEENTTLKDIPALKRALEFYRLACTPMYEADGVTPDENSYQATMLKWGIEKLEDIRGRTPSAGGLVIAPNIEVAEYMAELLEKLDEEKPMLVHSGQSNTQNKIKAFRNQVNKKWLVSVAMISEGVDIPRLRVLVYLPSARTELAFRQAMGRVVRNLGPKDESRAYVVMPKDKVFDHYARRVENEMSPGKKKEEKPKTKLCPICEYECSITASECPECEHKFTAPRPPQQKTCDACGHLNPLNATSCENCGQSFENEFTITLEEAMREGTIVRGGSVSEDDTQWGEKHFEEFRDAAIKLGDPRMLKILKDWPPESLAGLRDIIANLDDDNN